RRRLAPAPGRPAGHSRVHRPRPPRSGDGGHVRPHRERTAARGWAGRRLPRVRRRPSDRPRACPGGGRLGRRDARDQPRAGGMTTLADRLEAAVRSGDWEPLRAHVHPAVALRTSNERGRRRLDGADAVLEHLGGPGAGEVDHWQPREWPAGVALTFEWTGASGTDRRRWYVRRDAEGLVTEMWSSAARPGA